MNYFIRKRIFAVIFVAALFIFSIINLRENGDEIVDEAVKQYEEKSFSASDFEDEMLENIICKRALVETYGATQRILLKQEYNDFEYIKDNNGFLNYAALYMEDKKDIFQYALRIKKLQDYVEPYGTKVLFVITPSKYDKQTSKFVMGMPVNNPDNDVDELMVYLNRMGIQTLNLGEYFPNDELTYEQSFFRTDHHWTVPAAFQATNIIVDTMNKKFDAGLDPDGYYMSKDTYDYTTYYGHMLGAMGRGTGLAYSGLENFTAMFPKYTGNFTRTYLAEDGDVKTREGSYEDAFLDFTVLSDDVDYYVDSQYSLYIDQIRYLENIENLDNPDGKNIFMIRDSYFGPVITFMAPLFHKIDAIYSLIRSDDITITNYLKEQYMEGNPYDYVIVEVYPYNITEEAFRYFRGD